MFGYRTEDFKMFKRFLKDEKGLETVEWTIMAALIVLGIVLAVSSLKDEIAIVFGSLEDEMASATAPAVP